MDWLYYYSKSEQKPYPFQQKSINLAINLSGWSLPECLWQPAKGCKSQTPDCSGLKTTTVHASSSPIKVKVLQKRQVLVPNLGTIILRFSDNCEFYQFYPILLFYAGLCSQTIPSVGLLQVDSPMVGTNSSSIGYTSQLRSKLPKDRLSWPGHLHKWHGGSRGKIQCFRITWC